MNRVARYAYDLGWAAQCLGLPVECVTQEPVRETLEEVVMPSFAFIEAAERGFKDAICGCGHHWGTHDDDYGCRGSLTVKAEAVECFCTGFQSAALMARTYTYQRIAANRRTRQEEEEEAA